jgi:hypothetical protein
MKITKGELRAIVALADQLDKPGGLTGYGPKFSRAMEAMRSIRARAVLSGELDIPDDKPSLRKP